MAKLRKVICSRYIVCFPDGKPHRVTSQNKPTVYFLNQLRDSFHQSRFNMLWLTALDFAGLGEGGKQQMNALFGLFDLKARSILKRAWRTRVWIL